MTSWGYDAAAGSKDGKNNTKGSDNRKGMDRKDIPKKSTESGKGKK